MPTSRWDYFVWVAIPLDESGKRTIGGKPIVIDTGFNAQVGKKRGREVKRNPADLLADFGIDPKEVEDVIITHLHYDHVGNWDKFPKARFHLQDKEMQFATGRHVCMGAFRHAFEVDDIVGMVRALYGKRVAFHDGDEEIQPGISVHLIGGHTMGMQSVRVMTRNGWLVLASDASHYYWGIEKNKLFAIVLLGGRHAGRLRQAEEAGRRPPRDGGARPRRRSDEAVSRFLQGARGRERAARLSRYFFSTFQSASSGTGSRPVMLVRIAVGAVN